MFHELQNVEANETRLVRKSQRLATHETVRERDICSENRSTYQQ